MKRDYFAGGLMVLIGIGAAFEGRIYGVGTLAHMAPGFFPVALGIVLLLVGILIGGASLISRSSLEEHLLPDKPQWLGWLCVLGGPIAFIVFGLYGGMIPATFVCVLVCALGDKTARLKSSLVLAAGITAFGIVLFHYLLQIPFPLLRWV